MFSIEFASVKGSLFLLQKAPSILPLSLFSYEVNGSGALLARFGKKLSVSNQQLKEYAYIVAARRQFQGSEPEASNLEITVSVRSR